MDSELQEGSPLAVALHGAIQPKLVEYGWVTSVDETTLSEYIILMLSNGKNEDEVAHEIAVDLLALGPESPEPKQFARWLFEQVHALRSQLQAPNTDSAQVNEQPPAAASSTQDAEMGDGAEPSTTSM
jgi:hypothetical protein